MLESKKLVVACRLAKALGLSHLKRKELKAEDDPFALITSEANSSVNFLSAVGFVPAIGESFFVKSMSEILKPPKRSQKAGERKSFVESTDEAVIDAGRIYGRGVIASVVTSSPCGDHIFITGEFGVSKLIGELPPFIVAPSLEQGKIYEVLPLKSFIMALELQYV